MPVRPATICSYVGCSARVREGSGRCRLHPRPKHAWGDDRKRGSRHQRGYGTVWDKLRKRILLRDDYLCQVCQRARRLSPATAVDHIRAKALGGSDDPLNLQSICGLCHSAKTARERDK
ncbi:MAG: HNH endonuclease [Chromatiales bacterium]|nr:HNH endonuclease [Gammaproteobacteria bacterium]